MKAFTLRKIRNLSPCYDPCKYLPETWKGTVLDILNIKKCPVADRMWVVRQLVSERVARLFACACAEESFKLQKMVDLRSLEAVKVARAYALGQATKKELAFAESAAWSAAWSARSAAWSARSARSAAWSAESAAWSAAESAAESAAWSARSAAESAAWSARSAAKLHQIEILKQLITDYEE